MKVGILGAGQLGRMLALAGYPLDLQFSFYDPAEAPPAAPLGSCVRASFDNVAELSRWSRDLDVLTYEFENVDTQHLDQLAKDVPLYPPVQALKISQDRLTEKDFLNQLGVKTARYVSVANLEDLQAAIGTLGTPSLLKTRRFGYDGKGQCVIDQGTDLESAWQQIGQAPAILEGFVGFQRELSLIAVRGRDGADSVFYPLVQNYHQGGILQWTLAPAPEVSSALQTQAEKVATKIFEALSYVGVLSIEFFEDQGELIVNEIAPRVHNSGHWSIEGAETSQFENHLRAITGLPLGSPEISRHSLMLNIIGKIPEAAPLLALPGSHLHLYGKTERQGRKLGHLTLTATNLKTLIENGRRAASFIDVPFSFEL